jgi:hypothetical protein
MESGIIKAVTFIHKVGRGRISLCANMRTLFVGTYAKYSIREHTFMTDLLIMDKFIRVWLK